MPPFIKARELDDRAWLKNNTFLCLTRIQSLEFRFQAHKNTHQNTQTLTETLKTFTETLINMGSDLGNVFACCDLFGRIAC